VLTEVTKALQARKCEKMKKMQNELVSEKEQKEKYRNHHDKHYEAQRRHNEQVHILLYCKKKIFAVSEFFFWGFAIFLGFSRYFRNFIL
jgi:hypothetical protein